MVKHFPFLLFLLASLSLQAQTGPWAKYDQELKDGALYREASAGNLDEVKSIIAGGGNPKFAFTQTLQTPLMAAAGSGKIEVVRYLLGLGADPAARDWWGQTAADKARSVGAKDIAALLEGAAPPVPPEVPTREEPVPAPPKSPVKVTPDTRPAAWATFGTYRTGDTVLYWVPTGWRKGIIKEVGPIQNEDGHVAPTEKKYLIHTPQLGNDWYEWSGVVRPERQPFWTQWFVGEWKLGEGMAYGSEARNGRETRTYLYSGATDLLRVHANGTYRWVLSNGKVINGRWTALPGAPGIVLIRGWQGEHYTLRNKTGVHDWSIRHMDLVNLAPASGRMSIDGNRKSTL